MSALAFRARSLVTLKAIASVFWWGLPLLIVLVGVKPALAHHPFGGETPSNFLEGLLSGLGHPVIGLDHLVFTIAVGMLAASSGIGILMLVGFILATVLGTGIHLLGIELPLAELIIAASVLTVGILLSRRERSRLSWLLTVVAGIFHGYAYGEAIFGAEMTPLSAYLLGFCLIQLAIGAIAFTVGKLMTNNSLSSDKNNLNLRFVGFTVLGLGLAFFANTLIG